MRYQVTPIRDDLTFGAVVTGLVPEDIRNSEVRLALYDLWLDRGLILFRGLPDDGQLQIEISEIYGSPEAHPLRDPNSTDPMPKLVDIFFRPEEGDIVRFGDGTRKGAYLPWHFDLCYLRKINRGGILRAVTKSKHGGETGFLDRVAIYAALPERLKQRIEGKYAIYRYEPDISLQRFGRSPGLVHERISPRSLKVMERIDQFPPVAHPLVFNRADNGAKVLNFSPWYCFGIEGLDQAESDDILNELVTYATDETNAYFHVWDSDDMVLFDNWRMLHVANGVPADEVRHVQRTTIQGDYGLGRVSALPEYAKHLVTA